MLILPTIIVLSLRIFGTPQHVTRRPSSVKFWATDLSCGAGAISSPVLLEHPKNVSEIAVFAERAFASLSSDAPPWLLISAIGIATRELASRQVENELVPALVTSGDARPKARALSQVLRRNLDDRITRVLAPAGYKSGANMLNRFVEGELGDMKRSITSIDDVVEHEITRAVLEVAEAEVAERIQGTFDTLAGVNQTSAERDLYEVMRRADSDGNSMLTFDELYELMSGAPIDPLVAPVAREWVVLKTPQEASNRWERWGSLVLAPQLKKLAQVSAISRNRVSKTVREVTQVTQEVVGDLTGGGQLTFRERPSPANSILNASSITREEAPESWPEPVVALPEEGVDEPPEPEYGRTGGWKRLRRGTRMAGTRGRWRKPWRWLRDE